jgi:DNA polymerase I
MNNKQIFIVDGSGLLYRAYYAFLSQRMSRGALYGFTTMLLALIREQKAAHLAVAFDLPGPTFRHELYSDYKANREETPPELVEQFPLARDLVEAMGIATLQEVGMEADDLIGSLATVSAEAGWDVVIVSGDKDFAQLIGGAVRQFIPARAGADPLWLDPEGIAGKYGITPQQFIDYLALVGDKSDNVPGVKGIGPKGAAKLLQAYGDLNTIYENLSEITPPGIQKKLTTDRDNAYLSQVLVTIKTDLEAGKPEEAIVPDPASRPQFLQFLNSMKFRSIADRLTPVAPARPGASTQTGKVAPGAAQSDMLDLLTAPAEKHPAEGGETEQPEIADDWDKNYHVIHNLADLANLKRRFTAERTEETILAIDTETSSLDSRNTELVGISFAWNQAEAWYLPLQHNGSANLPLPSVRELINPWLQDPSLIKIGQNLKFDIHVLRHHGFTPEKPFYDTMIAAYLCDPEGRHNLDSLSDELLGHAMLPISALIGRGKQQKSMATVPVSLAGPYACEDVDAVLRIWPILAAKLKEINAWDLYTSLEMPLMPLLAEMEENGIYLDSEMLAQMSEKLAAALSQVEGDIHGEAGEVFNLNSPKQLQVILFDQLKLPKGRKTKTGYSTNQAVLEELADGHPLPAKILEYRQLTKLQGTYVQALPKMVDPRTGRIHTAFHQTVAATGRLSSSNPNLQNIPIRTPMGREIRRAFAAPSGRVLVAADYSQVELRLLAHLSQDEYLCEAFRNSADIHRATAARVFSVDEADVQPEMRGQAKTVNFGVIYGMGAQRLARQLKISVKEASKFIQDYFEKLPGVKQYIDESIASAREKGYAETLLGRRRYLPDLLAQRHMERAQAERMALNTPVQGSAADLIKLAMLRVAKRIETTDCDVKLLLQVHDELVVEVPENEAEAVSQWISQEMIDVFDLTVPLKVDTGCGRTWYEAHG